MSWKKPTINKIEVDIKKLSIYIRTIKKFGKTTLFRDVVLEKYGDPSRGMLVKIGAEQGDTLLDELNSTEAEKWKDFEEMKKWLIKEKGKEHNIEMLCFDVVDEFFPALEEEVVRLSNVDGSYKKCKTVNGAFGGFTEGTKKVVKMAKDYFRDLQKAGFSVWALAHTKYKAIKEKGDIEDGYMSLTSMLPSAYEGVFGDIFDCVCTGMIDRELEEEIVGKDIKGKDKIKKQATAEIRKLYLRGTTSIDAGGRFADGSVPEYIVFDKSDMSKDFIRIMEEGMEKSKSKYKKGNLLSSPKKQEDEIKLDDELTLDDPIEEKKEEADLEDINTGDIEAEDEKIEEDEDVVDLEQNKQLKKEFISKYKKATKEQKIEIKKVMDKYDTKKLDEKKPTKMFKELLAIFE